MEKNVLVPIVYNQDHFTVMANSIVKGKQEMTLQEARVIRLLITQVVKEDKDLKTYIIKIKDLASFLGVDSSNLYKDIRDLCSSLLKRLVYISTGDPREPWESFQWVQLARYDGRGNLTLMLSEQLKPYILELEKWFTQYRFKEVLSMDSFYAIRLYELIVMSDGEVRYSKDTHEFSIKFLREFFCCESKFERISDFKRKVIELSIREINQKSDKLLYVDYIKTGKRITSVKFEVHENFENVFRRDEI